MYRVDAARQPPGVRLLRALSSWLDVYIGQEVTKGDKIGEIDPPFTFQNDGYRSHVHLGIEKAAYTDAIVAGYHPNIEHWYDPVAFIGSRRPASECGLHGSM